jgi:Sec-independent protein secretion pathway component TatC
LLKQTFFMTLVPVTIPLYLLFELSIRVLRLVES